MKPILIPLPTQFSFNECLWFLDRNFDDCMHAVQDGQVMKVITIGGEDVLIKISQQHDQLVVTAHGDKQSKITNEEISAYVQDWFDLNRDLKPFYKKLKAQPAFKYMVDAFAGLRLIAIPDLFEALCWSIIGQQINLTFAYKLKRRMVEHYGTAIQHEGHSYHIFPAPEVLADATVDDLKSMQFSTQKANYIISTAKAFANGTISKASLQALPDTASRLNALIAMKGIGVWTANYALMKSLKDPCCIPHGDAGLLNALLRHEIIHDKKDNAAIETLFKNFAGWESYLVFYLWRSLAKK